MHAVDPSFRDVRFGFGVLVLLAVTATAQGRFGGGEEPLGLRATLQLAPPPPALGDALPYAEVAGTPIAPAYRYSREIFYGPYAALVFRQRISADQIARVTAYRAERDRLVGEIEARLDGLADATAAARATALRDLARVQQSRLQTLEAEAERIRGNLAGENAANAFFRAPPDLKIGDLRTLRPSLRLFRALYHGDGLSVEQRLLLPEMAYDSLAHSPFWLCFLPATTHVRLPPNLSPELHAKIRAFAAGLDTIKEQLRDAVLRESHSSYFPPRQFAPLAAQQAPQFAALEHLAEEIRVGLAEAGDVTLPYSAAWRRAVGERCYAALQSRAEMPHRDPATDVEQPAAAHNTVPAGLAGGEAVRETWDAYRNYYSAVLQPGLSPAQRRVLLQAAAERLDVTASAGLP